MIIGAHVGIAGGLSTAIVEAEKLHLQAFQIFSSSPRMWTGQKRSKEEIDHFTDQLEVSRLGPVFVHAKYLVNLGSANQEIITKSRQSLIYDLDFSSQIKAQGVIVHIGSFKNTSLPASLKRIITYCRQILQESSIDSRLILENSAGAGQTIGAKLEDIGYLIAQIQSPRVGFCFDTCHAFASGYDLRQSAGIKKVQQIIEAFGPKKLVCLHANDSMTDLGSNRDRHANLGFGHIGRPGFLLLAKHPLFADLPWIIETPNLKEGQGQKDLQWLKKL